MRSLALLVMLLLAMAGCTDDSGADDGTDDGTDGGTDGGAGDGTDGTDGTDGNGTGGSDVRQPITWDIDVGDNSFSESSLTIMVGDTVRWTQSGSNPHTVTQDDGDFDSHPDCSGFQDSILGNCMEQDDTFEWTFDAVAEVGYYCKIHGSPGSGMSGTISVLEGPSDTLAEA